jgi:dTDP-4-dehydrorhamnose 3,5-epimerase
MRLLDTNLPEVLLIEPQVFEDPRGFFMESFNQQRYAELGLDIHFVQDNVSRSVGGVLRGLHFQNPYPQGKLVYVLEGEVFDVAVDIRVGSPRFGQWTAARLSAANKHQMYIPAGFAHGFCTLSPTLMFTYKCTEFYHREAEQTLCWNDPAIGIEWPVAQPVLSEKDSEAPGLENVAREHLPAYAPPE